MPATLRRLIARVHQQRVAEIAAAAAAAAAASLGVRPPAICTYNAGS